MRRSARWTRAAIALAGVGALRRYLPPPGTDPRPTRDEIVLLPLAGENAQPIALAADAYAQQLLPRDLIYAEENGPDVILWRAALR